MGFLGGVIGGAASSFGNYEDQQRNRKQALTDQEHEQALNDHNNTIATLQGKMAQVGPNHPDYGTYQNQLNQAVEDRTALFHPDQPGGAERLGKLIWAKLHGKEPQPETTTETTAATPGATLPAAPGTMGVAGPTLPSTPGVTIERPAITPAERTTRNAQDLANGAPATPVNTSIQFRSQMKAAFPNASDEDLDKWTQIHAGVEAKPVAPKDEVWTSRGQPFQDPESGDWMQPQFNKSGEPRNQPLPGYAQATKQSQANAAVQRREYAQAAYGDPNHALTFGDEQNMIKLVKQAGTGTTTGGHFGQVPDKNGDIHTVWMPTSSSKNFGGVQPGGKAAAASPTAPTSTPSATTPKTAGAAKKAVAAVKPKNDVNAEAVTIQDDISKPLATRASPGAIVGGRNTGAQTDALKKAQDADKGYLDVQKAGNGDPSGHKVDPVGSQQIVLAWLRGRVNRVTATEIAAVNNLGGLEMKMEGNYAKIVKGTMSPQQYQWFLKSARDNSETARQVANFSSGKGPNPTAPAAPSANAPAFDWNAHPVVK